MRLTPLDILLIIICIFLLLRFLSAKKNGGDDSAQDEAVKKRALNAYKRAERAWDMLRDEEEEQPVETQPQALHGEFDPKEFLSGAKLAYSRIKQSWDDRDLDDLKFFTTEKAFAEFERRVEDETRSPRTDILLVEANIVERRNNGVTQSATVLFDVTLREGAETQSKQIQEVWTFTCSAENANDHWKLDAIQNVEDSYTSRQ